MRRSTNGRGGRMVGAGVGAAEGGLGGSGSVMAGPIVADAHRRRTSPDGRGSRAEGTVRRACARADPRASARAGAPANGSTERPAHDVDHLVDVLIGLAALRGGPDAALDVVLE